MILNNLIFKQGNIFLSRQAIPLAKRSFVVSRLNVDITINKRNGLSLLQHRQPLSLSQRLIKSTQFNRGFSTGNINSQPIQQQTRRVVGWWMLGTSALVFGTVVVGGITRLTESGLSMVDWSLLGSRPPSSPAEWQAYFEKYQQYPEYKVLNRNMTVDEFKNIFWLEYVHRMIGRVIGVFWIVPGVYFVARGFVTPSIRNRIIAIAGMIGCQGLLGWYMVKSGLDEGIIERREVPRVSQYRLASHLGVAFVIYLTTFFTGLSILSGTSATVSSATAALGNGLKNLTTTSLKNAASLKKFKNMTHVVASMIFLTALSGAFVAGLDAGLIYNTFPMMADRWIPSDIAALEPLWKNIFENPTTVQFNHRVLAVSTFTAISLLWAISSRYPLSRQAKLATNALMLVGMGQVALGISTLLYLVPVPLAAAHQAGSLTLLTVVVWLMHALKHVPK